MIELHDHEEGYCRKLGHHLNFKYCRRELDGKPCNKIQDCWFEKFNVASYMNEFYQEQATKPLNAPQPNKTVTLFSIIQQVQERQLLAQAEEDTREL